VDPGIGRSVPGSNGDKGDLRFPEGAVRSSHFEEEASTRKAENKKKQPEEKRYPRKKKTVNTGKDWPREREW
jgi:hypothetical protein